ncbi:MAG: hypothetical protein M1825_002986 [Sarcosagium campestre]|nr:MAG: hypothetical protein M1825_002986 [Sarcosagium campestre]
MQHGDSNRRHGAGASREEDDHSPLQQLEPSPVDDDPNDQFFSAPPPPLLSRSSTLGLSGHNVTYYLSRIQRYSSYTFTIFLTFHIANTSLIPLATRSLPAADTYLLLTRPYYQSPLAEPAIVVLPLLAHVASGVALRLYRRNQQVKRYGVRSHAERRNLAWPKLSGTSMLGYVLAPLVAGHVLVNRIVPLWVDGGSSGVGLSYVSHGFAKHPFVAYAGYSLLIGTAAWHIVSGWAKWLGLSSIPPDDGHVTEKGWLQTRRWYGENLASLTLAAIWMAGGLGVVARAGPSGGWIGKGYDKLYEHVPVLGGSILLK